MCQCHRVDPTSRRSCSLRLSSAVQQNGRLDSSLFERELVVDLLAPDNMIIARPVTLPVEVLVTFGNHGIVVCFRRQPF